LEEFSREKIKDKNGKKVHSLRSCNTLFLEAGIVIKEKQATLKDLESWPQYLTKIKEKYRYIV